MKRALILCLLLTAVTLAASTKYEHPPSVNEHQQKQGQRDAQRAMKKQARAQKKQLRQEKRDAKNRPHTTTTG